MEELLARVTQQAMNYAIRSGIAITASYAFSQSARLIRRAEDSKEKVELEQLHRRLESKIKIMSPAIDMIELIAARGNTSLETAVSLIKSLRWDIQALGRDIAAAASDASSKVAQGECSSGRSTTTEALKRIIASIRQLLARIEDAVPLINLAITTSGANLSTSLPHTVSPSRLLQASTFITAGDTQYSTLASPTVQIGPTFTLSLYMLFAGHVRPHNERDLRRTTWKEVIHKARVKLVRVALGKLHDVPDHAASRTHNNLPDHTRNDEFAYQLLIVEDLDDGRVHDESDAQSRPYDDVLQAGIKEPVPIHEISKIFYADTGKILNIGGDVETNSPVLLLKRDLNAIPPRRMLERTELEHPLGWDENDSTDEQDPADPQSEIDAQLQHESRQNSLAPEDHPADHDPHKAWRIPPDLDPEWLAFEVYTDDAASDSDSDVDSSEEPEQAPAAPHTAGHSRTAAPSPGLSSALSNMHLQTPSPQTKSLAHNSSQSHPSPAQTLASPLPPSNPPLPAVKTSLSLLETMLRLLSLQQFQQQSHLSIPDELLSFFLSEAAATTGAPHGDDATRRRMRATATRNLGFDPYDESPIKPRGEEYLKSRGDEMQQRTRDGEMQEQQQQREWHSAEIPYGGTGWTPLSARAEQWGRTTRESSTDRRLLDEGYHTNPFPSSPVEVALPVGGSSPLAGKGSGGGSGRGSGGSGRVKKERRHSPLVRGEGVD